MHAHAHTTHEHTHEHRPHSFNRMTHHRSGVQAQSDDFLLREPRFDAARQFHKLREPPALARL
eukprot:6203168-Pleurochrysis_carterae.AAC.3